MCHLFRLHSALYVIVTHPRSKHKAKALLSLCKLTCYMFYLGSYNMGTMTNNMLEDKR